MNCFSFCAAMVVVLASLAAVHSRSMTDQEIIDTLIKNSPYKTQMLKALYNDGVVEAFDSDPEVLDGATDRVADFVEPQGVRARLILANDNTASARQSGRINLDREFPGLARLMRVLGAMRETRREGTKRLFQAVFPGTFGER